MLIKQFKIQFTEFIPEDINEGVLYISMPCAIAAHKCACGCGQEVFTPITPTDWKLLYDGESITLTPSIGNWSYPCRAHYFIKNNRVIWANEMSQKNIETGRNYDKANKARHYAQQDEKRNGRHSLQTNSQNNKTAGLLNAIARFFGFKRE